MTPLERAGFVAHARSRGFRARVRHAQGVVREWLTHTQAPYIAVSGGKDSTAMLHLVRELRPDAVAMWGHDEYVLPETLTYLDTVPNLRRIASRIQHTEWFWAWEDTQDLPEDVAWVTPGKNVSARWALSQGLDGAAVGIRVQENQWRRLAVRRYGQIRYVESKQLWQCWPLALWTVEDVWGYIVSRRLPYNAAYDRMDELGIPKHEQRVGPFANWRALPMGQASQYRRGWPELFRQFAERFPQVLRYT